MSSEPLELATLNRSPGRTSGTIHLFKQRELMDDGPGVRYDCSMRPIYQNHRDEITVQRILYALSDLVRVQIFSQLMGSDCSQNCTTLANVRATPLPKSTLSQHFKILREAGLIRSERKGVELQNRTRCEDLEKFKPMVREILAAYQAECPAARRATPAVSEPGPVRTY